MVRGPAALLAAGAGALAYFLLAGGLPDLGVGRGAVIVAALAGIAAIVAVVLSVARLAEETFALVLLLAGSALLVGAMDTAGARASVAPFEALAAGALGALVGRALASPAVALAIPVFVAIVDAWSVASGPSSRLVHGDPRGAAELTFDLPAWGDAPGASSRLGLTDAIFLAMFAVWARRFGLRRRATAVGMVAGLMATVVLSVLTDRAIPALPLMAVGYWLPNLDRLGAMFRDPFGGGNVRGMDLEPRTLETAGERCEECGAKLTDEELATVLESGGPTLCAVHAAERVPLAEEEEPAEEE